MGGSGQSADGGGQVSQPRGGSGHEGGGGQAVRRGGAGQPAGGGQVHLISCAFLRAVCLLRHAGGLSCFGE